MKHNILPSKPTLILNYTSKALHTQVNQRAPSFQTNRSDYVSPLAKDRRKPRTDLKLHRGKVV